VKNKTKCLAIIKKSLRPAKEGLNNGEEEPSESSSSDSSSLGIQLSDESWNTGDY
jgi:hypothetical protein